MAHVRSSRGFTLIELMVVVAIVGILTTVALPAFHRSLLRAKVAERATIMLRLKNAVQEYYVRTGSSLPAGVTSLDSEYNPPGAPNPLKRSMATNLASWNVYFSNASGGSSLPSEIEGGVYYSYRFLVSESAGAASMTIIAVGDLDGDGVRSTKRLDYARTAGVYQLTNESPLPGFEDDAGPDATF